jgi:group I intron endonuclease
MMTRTGVYILTDVNTKYFYIGSSYSVDLRVEQHRTDLSLGRSSSRNLQLAWDNGAEFAIEVFETATRREAYMLEQVLILENITNPLMLNIGLGVFGGDNLSRHPRREEIIMQTRASLAYRHATMTAEERSKTWGKFGSKNGMFGLTHTGEVRDMLSRLHTGNRYAVGCIRSPVQRAKLSEFAKTRTGSKNPFFGKRHSKETRAHLSTVLKGTLPPNTRPVSVNGVAYASVTEAAKALGCVPATVLNRINNRREKFKDYVFLSEMPND